MVRPNVAELAGLVEVGDGLPARSHDLALLVLHGAALGIYQGVGELHRVEGGLGDGGQIALAPEGQIGALFAKAVPLGHLGREILGAFLIESHGGGQGLQGVGLQDPALGDFLLAIGRPGLIEGSAAEDGLVEHFVGDFGQYGHMPGAGIV